MTYTTPKIGPGLRLERKSKKEIPYAFWQRSIEEDRSLYSSVSTDKWMQHPTFPIKNLLKFNPYLLVQSI